MRRLRKLLKSQIIENMLLI